MSVFEKLRRRKARKEFEKSVSPKVVKLIESGVAADWTPIRERRHFQFVVVQVDEARPEQTPALLEKIVDSLVNENATVSEISSSLVVGYFGIPFPESDSSESRLRLVNALLARHGAAVRIAHGQCVGWVGMLGSKDRFHWGAIIPDFSGVLKKLLESRFGSAIDLNDV